MSRLICDANRDGIKTVETLLFQQETIVYDIEDLFRLLSKHWHPENIHDSVALCDEVAGRATAVALESVGHDYSTWQTMTEEDREEVENLSANIHEAVMSAAAMLHADIVMHLPPCVEPGDVHSYDKKTMTYIVDFA